MSNTRYAFIKAAWHNNIVDQALVGFNEIIPADQVDVFDAPGAIEMPLLAQDLALTGQYDAIACAALVVDGGIYRHDFVAQAVVDGIVRVGLDTGVPVLSVSLTPHNYQPTEHHNEIYEKHFVEKGREAAESALMTVATRAKIAEIPVLGGACCGADSDCCNTDDDCCNTDDDCCSTDDNCCDAKQPCC